MPRNTSELYGDDDDCA